MADCLFCKIVAGEIPSKAVYEDDALLAFTDLHPQAPVHLLLIPKEHIPSLAECQDHHQELLGWLLLAARQLAARHGLNEGFRLVNNCGPQGGQTVHHLHFHLLGGRSMAWPPG